MISLEVLKGSEGRARLYRERKDKGRHVRKGTHMHNIIEGVYLCQAI
jgi:hypothetical protein